MSEERYKILFRGDLAEGFRRDDVRQKLIELFGLKAETVDTLLDGQTATLKKNLDREGALKFKQAFEKTGAICYIRPMDDSTATTAPHPPSTPLTQPAPSPPVQTQSLRGEPESFTVVDTAAPPAPEEVEAEPVFEIPAGPTPGTMTCPKCSFVQPKADFCEACGVVILKYLKRHWEEEQLLRQLEEAQSAAAEPAPAAEAAAEPSVEARPAPAPAPPRQQQSEPTRVERDEPDAFTVVDTAAPPAAEEVEAEPVFEIPAGPTPGTMTCPKCSFVQPMADFCESCGVVILKYLKRHWEEEQLLRQLEEAQSATAEPAPETAPPSGGDAPPSHAAPAPGNPPRVSAEAPPAAKPLSVPAGPTPGSMTCPKCSFVQPAADTCAACGVVILKYMQRMATEHQQATPTQGGDEDSDQEGDLAPSVPPELLHAPTTSGAESPGEPFRRIYWRAWLRLRSAAGQLVPLWLAALLLVALATYFHATLASRLPPPYPALLTGLITLLLLSLAVNATLHLLTDPYLQLRPALAIGLLRLGPFLWLHGCLLLILLGGGLALVVPGYLFARWFCLAPACFAAEQAQGLSCLLRSRAYTVEREQVMGKTLLQALPLPLATLAGLAVLPGLFKLLALLPLPMLFALLTVLYQDAAATRPQLIYDDRLATRLQWPAFGVAGLLVFTILSVLIFGSGRMRSGLYAVALHTGLAAPSAPGEERTTQPARDYTSGVVELELSGYRADVFLNGKQVMEIGGGDTSLRRLTSPVFLKPGHNLIAVRYTAQEGADRPEMQLRVFHWNLAELRDENLGRWRIDDAGGVRRYEFSVQKPGAGKGSP